MRVTGRVTRDTHPTIGEHYKLYATSDCGMGVPPVIALPIPHQMLQHSEAKSSKPSATVGKLSPPAYTRVTV